MILQEMPKRRRRRQVSSIKLKGPLSISVVLFVGIVIGYLYSEYNHPTLFSAPLTSSEINVCFSPEGNCEQAIIQEINAAQSEILVQTYSFTSNNIAEALIEAANRGVSVKVLYDPSQTSSQHSKISLLKLNNIPTKADNTQGLAHNKILIIDGKITITGSYNFTKAANLKNAENLIIIDNLKVSNIYRNNWLRRFNSSDMI